MTAFDKAWRVVKTRGFDIRDHEDEDPLGDALDAARSKKRTPLELPGYVRTGSSDDKADDLPMPVEKPFKMRKPGGCDHNFEITDEGESDTGTLYRTYTCSKCGESSTSSPS
jgi:hypothetical protein